MLTLAEYLKEQGIPPGRFARMCGWPMSTIHRLVHDQVRPNVDTVLAIHDKTQGIVGLESWRLRKGNDNGRRKR